jgi:2-iminobutanoate/2-iminopropanoate deaminase
VPDTGRPLADRTSRWIARWSVTTMCSSSIVCRAPATDRRRQESILYAPAITRGDRLAIAKGDLMTRQAVSSDQAPAALGPYSQAIVAGGFVFCSGTAGIDPATGAAGDGIEAQTELALRNLAAVLTAADASMADLVKVTIFYSDVDDFARLNAVYARHMPDPPPARSAPANVRLPHGLLVSIDAIAVLPAG